MRKNILAAVGLIGLGITVGVLLISGLVPDSVSNLFAGENTKIGASAPPVFLNEQAKALNNAFVAASEAVVPTVVSISVVMESKAQDNPFYEQFRDFFKFFGGPDEGEGGDEDGGKRRSEASGSGVIISEDGYIVTNNHVIENATEIKVTASDKKEYKAKLIGRDPLTDLALIKVEATGLPAVHFSKIDDVHIGEWVIAVGNPLGLNSTVTSGIVSAIGRGGLGLPNSGKTGGYSVENFIQTDAAINPGNSGGGLFNLEGSLVGINSAIATQTGTYIGYGFAIPVDLVEAVINDLINDGKINRGYIGVQIRTVDEVYAKSAGLDKVEGVLVNDVIKDGAAEAAGIEPGDIILEIDGKPVSSSNELQGIIVTHRAGDAVNLTIWRDSKKINKTVKLKARDEDGETASADSEVKPLGETGENNTVNFDRLGFTISPMTNDVKKDLDVGSGVYIAKVERWGAAAERGLAPNGVITKADRKKVNSTGEFKKIIESKKPGDVVLLQVKYKDSNRIIAIEIPG